MVKKMSLQERRDKEKSEIEEKSTNRVQIIKEKVDIIEKISDFEELSQIEKDVLKIAKKTLKLKKFDSKISVERVETLPPLVEKLYADCIAKLSYSRGYSKEELFLAIRSLEQKKWIVTNERRTKEEILNNPKYQEIIKFIKSNPGIHGRSKKIESELKITRNPFIKYLIVLEKFEIVRSRKFGKTLYYFLKDFPEEYEILVILFQNNLIPAILKAFIQEPSKKITAIANDLEVFHGTIQYHIKRLLNFDLLKSVEGKGKNIYNVNLNLLKQYNQNFQEPKFIEA